MSKPRLTVASCVSNTEAFEACVLESISFLREDLDISIIPVYNEMNLYSASIAANLAMEITKDRFLLYVHQDVMFKQKASETIARLIKNWSDGLAVVGSAGVRESVHPELLGKWGLESIENVNVGSVYDQNDELIWDGCDGFHAVHSVDEVLMLIDRSSGLRFDPSWRGYHFYGLDFCLQARSTGYRVAVDSIEIKHCGQYSSSIYKDAGFLKKLIQLHEKWSTRFSQMCAPYCHWDNNRIVSYVPFGVKDVCRKRIDVPRLSVTVSDRQSWNDFAKGQQN